MLRPLLNQRREDLRHYLRNLAQNWIEDPSNKNLAFERVRVRSQLDDARIPALRDEAEQAQMQVRMLERLRVEWLQAHGHVDAYAVVRLPRRLLLAETHDVRQSILGWCVKVAGDGEAVEPASVAALDAWLLSGAENRRSLRGAIISARRNVIEIMREPARVRQRWLAMPAEGAGVFDGRFYVKAPVDAQFGPVGLPPVVRRAKTVPNLAFSALPAVKLASGEVVCAVACGLSEVSATLCERFSF